ncbi:hydrolase, TatD family [Xenococcus sp. PCC 7305]|uniref:TatD family hydrolase n=1 Tax=Xenococcus sp. PCC 7305 TaxID=102125 RepID=UPI0002ABC412|nr:TatD family hydrolase [Xenococcus sp. PCC 7305]ELS01484.1 hydrolase, TatD family [Xenococcus sp. PCC 7305]
MQLIDTHVHINFDVFQGDLSSFRKSWQEAGVVHLVHSCVEPSEFQGIQSLADKFPELSFAVGLHPLDAHKWDKQTGQQIRKLAGSDDRVVAIGETGLDFYKADNAQQQKLALQTQLSIAQELDKPVIIHCRDAALSLKEQIEAFVDEFGTVKGVMHCWGGTPEETSWFLDLGFYISFSGTVTFKNAHQIKESAKIVPDNRLLIETDCPFLAPVPKRGKRPNQPAYVTYVAECLANLRGVSSDIIAHQTTSNACELFDIKLN